MIDSFKVYDYNQNGFISASDIRQFMNNYGHPFNDVEMNDMLRKADIFKDAGRINYNDFVKIMRDK